MSPFIVVFRPPVMLVSPFSGDVTRNREYARKCLAHSLSLGEAPFAPHLIYPQVLDDEVPAERESGIAAGFAWLDICRGIVVYDDLGISSGMQAEMDRAKVLGKYVITRKLPNFVAV